MKASEMKASEMKASEMRATVLVDNIGKENIPGEWGLSIYIEYKNQNILLDAGASGLFLENAEKLGKSMEAVDYAVLSHAHYDHANGMEDFFAHNSKAKFYVQESCQENCYGKRETGHEYIGLPKGVFAKYQHRITYTRGNYELLPGVSLISHTTRGLSEIGKRELLYKKEAGRFVPDDFSHEQSLVFQTEKGLVIFNSCSHGGVDNIIREVQEAFPGEMVYAVVGGFHLFRDSEPMVRELAKRIFTTGIQKIYTGHCTGDEAFLVLKEELGERAEQLSVGLVMEF